MPRMNSLVNFARNELKPINRRVVASSIAVYIPCARALYIFLASILVDRQKP